MTTIKGQKKRAWEYPQLILPEDCEYEDEPHSFYFDTTQEFFNTLVIYNTIPSIASNGQANLKGSFWCISPTLNNIAPNLTGDRGIRTGRAIIVTRLQARIWVIHQQNTDAAPNTYPLSPMNHVIIRIYIDKNYNGAADYDLSTSVNFNLNLAKKLYEPVSDVAMTTSLNVYSGLAWPNNCTEDRFICIFEEHITFNTRNLLPIAYSTVNGYPNEFSTISSILNTGREPAPIGKLVEADLRNIQIPIIFDDTQSANSLASITTNNIFITAHQMEPTASPQIQSIVSRLTYKQCP